MNIFLHVLTGHMVGDFALQTGRIAEMKRVGWQGLLLHVGLITASTILFTAGMPRWLGAVAFIAVTHLLIDSARTFLIPEIPRTNTLYFCIDQSTHLLVLILVSMWALPGYYTHPYDFIHTSTFWDRALLVTSVLIALVFCVPIMEALLYQDIVGNAPNHVPTITARTRLLGAIERVFGFLLMQTGYAFLVPLVFVPHYIYRLQKRSEEPRIYIFLRPTLSFVITLILGWIVTIA